MKEIRVIENDIDWLQILKELAITDYIYNIKRKIFFVAVDTTEDNLIIMNKRTIKEVEDQFNLRFDFIIGDDKKNEK